MIPREYLPIRSPADLAPLKADGAVYDLHGAVARLWDRSRGAVRFAGFLTTVLDEGDEALERVKEFLGDFSAERISEAELREAEQEG